MCVLIWFYAYRSQNTVGALRRWGAWPKVNHPHAADVLSETFGQRKRLQCSCCASHGKKNPMLRKTLVLLMAIAALGLGSTAMAKHGGGHRSSAHGGSVYRGGGYGGGGYSGGYGGGGGGGYIGGGPDGM
jgi:hypothetical protein